MLPVILLCWHDQQGLAAVVVADMGPAARNGIFSSSVSEAGDLKVRSPNDPSCCSQLVSHVVSGMTHMLADANTSRYDLF